MTAIKPGDRVRLCFSEQDVGVVLAIIDKWAWVQWESPYEFVPNTCSLSSLVVVPPDTPKPGDRVRRNGRAVVWVVVGVVEHEEATRLIAYHEDDPNNLFVLTHPWGPEWEIVQ